MQLSTADRGPGKHRGQPDDEEWQQARLRPGHAEDQQPGEQPVRARSGTLDPQQFDEDQDRRGEQRETEHVGRARPRRPERLRVKHGARDPAVRARDHTEERDRHSDRTGPPGPGQPARRSRGEHDERREHRETREPVEQGDGFDAGGPARRRGVCVDEPVVGERDAGHVRDIRWKVMAEFRDQGQVVGHVDIRRVGPDQVMLGEVARRRVDDEEREHRRERP